MKIAGIPNFARYESSFALISDETNSNDLEYFTIDEERLIRLKHTYDFPLLSMEYCLNQANINRLSEIDLLITDYARRPSFYNDGPGYKKMEHDYLKGIIDFPKDKIKIVNHHEAHAAGTFYPSGFDEAAIIVVDGMGSDLETQSIFYANKNELECVSKGREWGIGGLYSEVTKKLGFTGLNDVDLSGKTMGLAPYGRTSKNSAERFSGEYTNAHLDYSKHISRFPNNSIIDKTIKVCNDPNKVTNDYFSQLAFDIQAETENALIHLAEQAFKLTKCKNLCITGGVALNSVANGKVRKNSRFKEIYIMPCTSDTGISLALATYGYYKIFKPQKPKKISMKNAFTGRQYEKNEIKKLLIDNKLPFDNCNIKEVANLISKSKIVSWFVGGSEIGPRALGHRCILADPRKKEMKDILNKRVKHREDFRPFAPSVLEEFVSDYFPIKHKTPFMVEVFDFHIHKRKSVEAVVHCDGTGRLQTVSADECPKYYQLIKEFYNLTAIPILLNTSFNDKEPIVETPRDAIITFLSTDIDILVIEDFILFKDKITDCMRNEVVKNLFENRKTWIKKRKKLLKERYFLNYNKDQCNKFLEEEKLQSEWHLKYRSKYEIEKFIENQKSKQDKIILIGCTKHTITLYKHIYDFPKLNIIAFIDFKKEEDQKDLSNTYNIQEIDCLKTIKYEYIFISSHEFQNSIYSKLLKLEIDPQKIFLPYDNAGDTLEKHLKYLPEYNEIK